MRSLGTVHLCIVRLRSEHSCAQSHRLTHLTGRASRTSSDDVVTALRADDHLVKLLPALALARPPAKTVSGRRFVQQLPALRYAHSLAIGRFFQILGLAALCGTL